MSGHGAHCMAGQSVFDAGSSRPTHGAGRGRHSSLQGRYHTSEGSLRTLAESQSDSLGSHRDSPGSRASPGSHDRGGNPHAGTYIIESASRLQVSDTRHSQRATLLDFRAEIRFSLSLRLRSSLFLVCVRFLARGVFFGARPSVPSVDSRSIVRRQDTIEWTT